MNIDLFEPQLFRGDAAHVTAEPQKQSKHVAICLDCIRAEIPLCGQVMRQETGDVNGKIGGLHWWILRGMTLPNAAFTRAVISGKISAVRCR